ncbi:MAG: hypothetical protein FWG08_05155 [Propionibacteriaceae bacterium]|nr:hypothetical protein [Propionibacteriaceae bacterium]
MQFPRLRPPRLAVWRSLTELQVGGLDYCVILQQAPPSLATVVTCLDGYHHVDELRTYCSPAVVDELLETLLDLNQLTDGPQEPTTVHTHVVGHGGLARHLKNRLGSWEQTQHAPQVCMVAPSTFETDRVLAYDLTQRGVPHVIVKAHEQKASVGPWVIPGLSSCLKCSDLTRRDLDPTWPLQVFQFFHTRVHPPMELIDWATAVALAHLRAYARGLPPESLFTSIEMDGVTGRVTYREIPFHPHCECH